MLVAQCHFLHFGKYIFNVHWPNSLGLIEGFCTVCEPWVDLNPRPFALKATTLPLRHGGRTQIFECSYSSVLHPILLKLHILTRLIESFPKVYGLWSCIEKNVDPSRSPCLKIVDRKSYERRNFLVLRPVLLKIAYFDVRSKELR